MEFGAASPDSSDVSFASRRAGVAEICWLDPSGAPRATAVVPLAHQGLPALALLWSEVMHARDIAASPVVAWVLSDRRLAQRDWQPLLALGDVDLIEDRSGEVFSESMLDLELRKHPPSRLYADTLLLRRENWWFLPRLILVFRPRQVLAVGERTDPDGHGVLAVAPGPGSLAVDTVVIGPSAAGTSCSSLGGRQPIPPGDAVLLTHEFSVPDLERWARRAAIGRWDGRILDVVSPAEGSGLPPIPGLRERVRRHRTLERACRRALRAA